MAEAAEGADLPAGEADVPHAAPRQHLDGVIGVVVLRAGLVDLPHAARADGVEQHVRPEHEPLALAVEHALGLELGQRALVDEELGQGRRLGTRVPLEELADDLVELAAVDQAAAAEVPDEPFARAEVVGHHGEVILRNSERRSVTERSRDRPVSCLARRCFFGSPKSRTRFGPVKLAPRRFQAEADPVSWQNERLVSSEW